MLTTIQPQVTNPNQSGIITSLDLSPELIDALTAASVDLATVSVDSDGTVRVDTADAQIAVGEDDGWLTATVASDEGEAQIYEGRSLAALAAAIHRTA